MHLGIYSLKKTLFQGEVKSVNCQTLSGEITVLENHEPLISVLKKGTMNIVDKNGKEHYIPISSGFLETRLNDTKLIVQEETR